jgi:hypothetical protein
MMACEEYERERAARIRSFFDEKLKAAGREALAARCSLNVKAEKQPPTFDEAQQPTKTPTRTRKRKPTLASVARQAAKAGIPVARYDHRPDGTISVIPGKPSEATNNNNDSNNSNEWDGVLK